MGKSRDFGYHGKAIFVNVVQFLLNIRDG